MNQEILKGKWTEIKGEIQKTWGNLTGDDLEKTKGNLKSIAGLLQQKYGLAQEDASEKITELYSRFEDKKSEVVDKVSAKAEQVKHEIKQNLK